jgi:hypothetical protein
MSSIEMIKELNRTPPDDGDVPELYSFLNELQDLDTIIQHTPIGDRANSPECQRAYARIKAMHHPTLHECTVCGNRYGNSETVIKEDLSNLYGVCPWCEKKASQGVTA